jgi:hypothetical protein
LFTGGEVAGAVPMFVVGVGVDMGHMIQL